MKPKFSFSQIDLYKRCPKAYEFQHIKKIPQGFSVYAYFGSIIHNTLQKFYEIKKRNLDTPQLFGGLFGEQLGDLEKDFEDDSLENLLYIYNEKFNRENFGDEGEKFFERGEELLINFFEDENFLKEKEKNQKILSTPFLIEKKFQIDFGDFYINGRFDKINKIQKTGNKKGDFFGEDSYEIIDYKTGKLRTKDEVKNDLQLGLYCIALEKIGYKPSKAYLHFLDHSQKFYFEITEENLENSKKSCREFFENLNKKNFPAKPENSKCKHCSYKKFCEFRIQ